MTRMEYDAPGGMVERVRVPLEIEAWRMIREGVAEPSVIDHLSRLSLGTDVGVLSRIRGDNPLERADVIHDLAEATHGDGRFRPVADVFPEDKPGGLWSMLELDAAPMESSPDAVRPERVLVAGTPHLAELWQSHIYEATQGQTAVDIWPLWDLGSITEEEYKKIVKQEGWDLLLEVLVGPAEERRQLLELLSPHLAKQSQVWVHTLNLPATIIVQVIPENRVGVGFGGLPNRYGDPVVELSLPRNSDASDLIRAANTASAMNLQPFVVADEPGGVGARLVSTLINSTAYLVREGLVASEGVADREIRHALDLEESPFAIADEIGLDTVEGVILGLRAHMGEDRYRVCPSLTMRIESGALGRITGSGFYLP